MFEKIKKVFGRFRKIVKLKSPLDNECFLILMCLELEKILMKIKIV